MLKIMTSIIMVGLFSTMSFAAQEEASFKSSTKQRSNLEPEMATKGIRVGVFKPTYRIKAQIKTSNDKLYNVGQDNLESDFGVNIGYVQKVK